MTPREIHIMSRIYTLTVSYPTDWLTMSQLASRFGISEKQLRTFSLKMYGRSILAIRKEARIKLAAELLEQGLYASEVAYKLGFKHPTNFGVEFRKYFGTSPRKYRDKIKELV